MLELCAIIIPVYKDILEEYEELSFRQCLKLLYGYPIYIVTHSSLNISVYERISEEYKIQLQKALFPESFFKSVKGYNNLMMQKMFYASFRCYQYILIYQLDAFVFRDELSYWCKQGYDYIGSPWLDENIEKRYNTDIWRVGNGGFSLRRIAYFLKVLSWKLPLEKISIDNFLKFSELKKIPYIFGWKNTVKYYVNLDDKMNEDVFYTNFLRRSYIPPNLPSVDVAAHFAFEKYPSYLYEKYNRHLPFGCHAFLKYEYDEFWKQFIER